MLLNDVSKVSEENSGLRNLDCLVETLPCCFDNADRICICFCFIPNIVSLVQITMIALVVQCHVDVEYVAIKQDPLVRDAMTDDLVGRRTYRLGEMVVIEWRRV